jgi:hypothetical protein
VIPLAKDLAAPEVIAKQQPQFPTERMVGDYAARERLAGVLEPPRVAGRTRGTFKESAAGPESCVT